jgi:hypothetical protein
MEDAPEETIARKQAKRSAKKCRIIFTPTIDEWDGKKVTRVALGSLPIKAQQEKAQQEKA